MKIAFSTTNKNDKNSVVSFLKNNKNFYYVSIEELKKISGKKVFFIFKNTDKNYIKKITESFFDNNIVYVVHRSESSLGFFKKTTIIEYPINFSNFEKIIFSKKKT